MQGILYSTPWEIIMTWHKKVIQQFAYYIDEVVIIFIIILFCKFFILKFCSFSIL